MSFDFITIVTAVVVPTSFCSLLRYNLLQNHGSTSCFDTHEHLAGWDRIAFLRAVLLDKTYTDRPIQGTGDKI